MSVEKIKILIADDHTLYRTGLKTFLTSFKNLEVISEAENGRELLENFDKTRPDLILTDLQMPHLDGIAATHELVKRGFNKIIMLTTFDTEYLLSDALDAGIMGYVMKTAHNDEIIEAINRVHEGDRYFCPATTVRMFQAVQHSKHNPETQQRLRDYTDREKDIIRLICEEKSSEEIGKELFMSKRTVDAFRSKILKKMNVKTMAGLAIYAVKNFIYYINSRNDKKNSFNGH